MPSLSSPTQSMDTIYPEPMSRLHRRVIPKKRKGGSFRYRTQPVTFSEIQEVDEENIDDPGVQQQASTSFKSDLELNLLNKKFEEFIRTSTSSDSYKIEDNRINEVVRKVPTTTSTSRITNKSANRTSF